METQIAWDKICDQCKRFVEARGGGAPPSSGGAPSSAAPPLSGGTRGDAAATASSGAAEPPPDQLGVLFYRCAFEHTAIASWNFSYS